MAFPLKVCDWNQPEITMSHTETQAEAGLTPANANK